MTKETLFWTMESPSFLDSSALGPPLILLSFTNTCPPMTIDTTEQQRQSGVPWPLSEGGGKDDSVDSSLALMSILSSFDPDAIRKYFPENFFLGRTSIKPDRCMGLITNGLTRKIQKSEYFQRTVSAYQTFMASSMRESTPSQLPSSPSLTDTLDGRHLQKK